jgi:hypothetical protein
VEAAAVAGMAGDTAAHGIRRLGAHVGSGSSCGGWYGRGKPDDSADFELAGTVGLVWRRLFQQGCIACYGPGAGDLSTSRHRELQYSSCHTVAARTSDTHLHQIQACKAMQD